MKICDIEVDVFEYDLSRLERKELSVPRHESWFKKGCVILVNDKMQRNYLYELVEAPGQHFDPDFTPHMTPQTMLEYGVFEGKYCNDCRAEFPIEWFDDARVQPMKVFPNFFGVKSRSPLSEWKANGWIHEVDPRGWFQWYMRYYLGRRIPAYDEAQIKRWKAFARHAAQVKLHCDPSDVFCRPAQRQALLQWAYDPFVGHK